MALDLDALIARLTEARNQLDSEDAVQVFVSVNVDYTEGTFVGVDAVEICEDNSISLHI